MSGIITPPTPSVISYPLTAVQNGKRIRLELVGDVPVQVQVGDPGQTWLEGTYIEVVRVGAATALSLVPFDGSVTLNYLSAGASALQDGEYARVSLVSPGVWDMHIYPIVTTRIKPVPLTVITTNTTGTAFGSAADHNTSYRMTSPTDVTIVVPADNAWPGPDTYDTNNFNPLQPGPMPAGGSAIFGKHGAGKLTFVPGQGVTFNYPDSLTVSKLHAKVTLIKVGLNEWDLEGHFDPA